MVKIKCGDQELEEVIRNYISTNFKGFKRLSLLTDNLWSFDIYDKKPQYNASVELTKEDQLRINKIVCKMMTNGELIINLIWWKADRDDIEVAWAGE